MSNETKIQITLIKSLNGRHEKHIATANSLGLRKIDDSTIQPDNEEAFEKEIKKRQ